MDATAGKRERTKAANRAAILQAGLEVFADLGFGAATVRDIVRRTDLATGTFYNYFPDKEAVLRALLEEQATEVRRRLRAARAASTTLEDFVSSGFRAFYEFLNEDPLLFEVTRRNSGTIRTMFDEPALGGSIEELVEDIRAGIAAGALPELDAELLARAMVGAGFEIGVLMLEREPTDVEGAVAFITALFLGGIERLRGT